MFRLQTLTRSNDNHKFPKKSAFFCYGKSFSFDKSLLVGDPVTFPQYKPPNGNIIYQYDVFDIDEAQLHKKFSSNLPLYVFLKAFAIHRELQL
jgi:hypothetical protein